MQTFQTLLTVEVAAVDNGVLMTIEAPATPSVGDPLAQRSGFRVGATYYPSLEAAIANIQPVIAVHVSRKALNV